MLKICSKALKLWQNMFGGFKSDKLILCTSHTINTFINAQQHKSLARSQFTLALLASLLGRNYYSSRVQLLFVDERVWDSTVGMTRIFLSSMKTIFFEVSCVASWWCWCGLLNDSCSLFFSPLFLWSPLLSFIKKALLG